MTEATLFDDSSNGQLTDWQLLLDVNLVKVPTHLEIPTSCDAATAQNIIKTTRQSYAILQQLRNAANGCTRAELADQCNIEQRTVCPRIIKLGEHKLVWHTDMKSRKGGINGTGQEVLCHTYNRTRFNATRAFEKCYVPIAEYERVVQLAAQHKGEAKQLAQDTYIGYHSDDCSCLICQCRKY